MAGFRRAISVGAIAAALMAGGMAPSWTQTSEPAAPAKPDTPPATDPFGEEVMLTAKTIVYMKGSASWDNAYDTLVSAFKSIQGFLDREKINRDGPPMTIYTSTDDTGFQFQAAIPVSAAPTNPPQGDLAVGKSPEGKALKFVHRGSYDAMDTTYDAITNHLDEKRLEAKELFIEQYVTDPTTTPEEKLVIEVYVPLKQ
jgi:effector-binding domain-containing protein